MAPVVATSKGQSRPPGRRPLWPTQTHLLHPMAPKWSSLTEGALSQPNQTKNTKRQILLYPQDNLSPVLCHAPVSRAWWTSSTGHVTVTRAVPRQWWSTWPEGHSRGMAPVVETSKGQSRPPGRRPLLAYSNPSPSSHGSEMVKSDRRGFILTKPNQTKY